ncbi:DUF292 domain protein [Aspergillus melleus]|uniref:DUF292 domain protein n=1 Tax=Aspergillus melleus TaxID=138277 RepID=UPI001E8D6D8F|nr:Vacuolar protein sorting-associated protein ist1 [Aspergillus melleus]KAH8426329.1 Vacuolar protein sorting-associated protein ist1 [Aspergillus melleus]
MPPSPQTTKLTSTLHLLIPRLRLLQKKSTASSVVQRRELSHLLSEGREASARIRVENVIATDISVEVLEMVELYCELILARANVVDQAAFGEKGVLARNRAKEVWGSLRHAQGQGQQLASGGKAGHQKSSSGFSFWNPFGGSSKSVAADGVDSAKLENSDAGRGVGEEDLEGEGDDEEVLESKYIDPALDEAAAAIFYAYPRFPHDVRELTILRTLLADRWGKDFMALAADNKFPRGEGVKVPARLVKGLRAKPPSTELVESYLLEIARAYGVNWGAHLQGHTEQELGEAPGEFEDQDNDAAESKDGAAGGDDAGPGDLPSTPAKPQRRQSDTAELNRVTPPRGLQAGKSPVSVAPPGPRSDNPNPRVKVPDSSSGKVTDDAPETQTPSKKSGGIPELDELTKRFAALRR